MHAVFFSERYDAEGGATDYFGQVEFVDDVNMLDIVTKFIIDRMMDSSRGRQAQDDSSTTRFHGRYRVTTLNTETLERSFGFVIIEKSGRLIQMFDNSDEEPGWVNTPVIKFPHFTYDVQFREPIPL